MAKMKLDPVYPDIVNRFQYVKTTNADAWQKYVKSVIAEHTSSVSVSEFILMSA